jgi:hypothetical protein
VETYSTILRVPDVLLHGEGAAAADVLKNREGENKQRDCVETQTAEIINHKRNKNARESRLTGGLEAQLLISQGKVAPPHSGASWLKKYVNTSVTARARKQHSEEEQNTKQSP